jgi:hypothetical protein
MPLTFETTGDDWFVTRETNVDGLSKLVALPSVDVMDAHQTRAFSRLLTAWNRREEARDQRDLASLAAARQELEIARTEMHTVSIGR